MRKSTQILFASAAAAAILALGSGCSMVTEKRLDALQTSPADGTAGIRNALQLQQSMSAVTGVPTSNSNVSSYYQQVKYRLSYDGNVQAVSPSILLAQTSLAGVYCKELINADKAISTASSRRAHAAVDFTKDAAGLTPSVRSQVLNTYANLFLRRDLSADEAAQLSQAMDDAIAALKAANVTGQSQTVSTLLVPCTALLGGLEFSKS